MITRRSLLQSPKLLIKPTRLPLLSNSLRPHPNRSLPTRLLPRHPSLVLQSSRFNSTHAPTVASSSTTSTTQNADANAPLMTRLRTLFRTHGWSALAVYLLLSAVDLSLTFLLIYAIGADRVREAEDWVLDKLEWRRMDGSDGKVKRKVEEWRHPHKEAGGAVENATGVVRDALEKVEGKVGEEKEKVKAMVSGGAAEKSKYGTIATTAVLAYAIHKTLLLPVRVGITIAITPRIVRVLQSWGWKVGMAAPATGTVKAATATAVSKEHIAP